MPFLNRFTIVIFLWLGLLLCCACNNRSPEHPADRGKLPDTLVRYYNELIIAIDTLNQSKQKALVESVLSLPREQVGPYYAYFKGLRYKLAGIKDSALYCYRLMQADTAIPGLYSLQQYALFSAGISGESIVPSDKVAAMLKVIRQAEQEKSIFVYLLYDLLAQTYYINGNIDKAVAYTDRYFQYHPLHGSPVIQQRYHDISFMLAAKREHAQAMKQHLEQARELALRLGDSMALARTYDYEGQLHSVKKEHAQAVASTRIFFNYLKQHNLLKKYAFNNLATSFVRNQQPDSAIYYYEEAIQWARQHPGASLFGEYQGLAEVYRKQGDYKKQAIALDSAINIFGRNVATIEAGKIAELQTRYETEKKDQAIASLQTSNRLSRRLITQQRWIFLATSLLLGTLALIIYNSYRRKLLLARNEKLSLENRKLLLEQKALQLQLDPHFIYNAVANMQGLISSDKKKEANAYLVTFSSLMRNMLELNRQDLISVDEEINALEHYIRLQQMRFENVFDYNIDTGDLDTSEIQIPPMLVQPFVENAVEHGFKNIEYKGMLQITFTEEEGSLHISVRDNGVGAMEQGRPEKKSLSGAIIRERLDVLFNQEKTVAYFKTYSYTPEQGKGYLVDLYIPLLTA
ncbi:histidine kinase [Taibaiella koreensis]|uniref:histidine kinase n=1 Tax=Taibaiella koreensis TaxID=1268548 RepID=UPI0013C2ECE1|nr:histidine kinase [Taibaiella koreensis]